MRKALIATVLIGTLGGGVFLVDVEVIQCPVQYLP